VKQLIEELKLDVKELYLIVNRVPDEGLSDDIKAAIEGYGLKLAGTVPLDAKVFEYDNKGIPLVKLPKDSVAVNAARQIFDEVLISHIKA